jgi:hypothetical protein
MEKTTLPEKSLCVIVMYPECTVDLSMMY